MSAAPPTDPPQASRTILVVDDEEGVRKVIRLILAKTGYTVLEAGNMAQAMSICRRFPATIHLLLLDIVLPDVDGAQLHAQLLPMCPHARVLYMSGSVDPSCIVGDEHKEGMVRLLGVPFLQKPFTHTGLIHTIRTVLDRPNE
jgi:two-component system cell cycle sensor histidine kinase/response regulator CckA